MCFAAITYDRYLRKYLSLNFVLFAAGSPLIVEYEEALEAAGGKLIASVSNTDVASLALDQSKVVAERHLDWNSIQTCKTLIPLFTPGHRHKVAQEIHQRASAVGKTVTFGTLIHPSAVVARSAQIAQGSFVNASVTIGADTHIGDHCVINRTASIGHHVTLEDYVSIGPGATLAGQISVGRGTVIGAGAVIAPCTAIGENSVVAAGSVVTAKKVPSNVVVSGNPARQRGRAIVGYAKTCVPHKSTSDTPKS